MLLTGKARKSNRRSSSLVTQPTNLSQVLAVICCVCSVRCSSCVLSMGIVLCSIKMYDYSLTPSQTWTVWSADLSVKAFVDDFASFVIDQIVVQLCGGVRDVIDGVQLTIDQEINAFETAFAALNTELDAFKSTVGGGVPRFIHLVSYILYKALNRHNCAAFGGGRVHQSTTS